MLYVQCFMAIFLNLTLLLCQHFYSQAEQQIHFFRHLPSFVVVSLGNIKKIQHHMTRSKNGPQYAFPHFRILCPSEWKRRGNHSSHDDLPIFTAQRILSTYPSPFSPIDREKNAHGQNQRWAGNERDDGQVCVLQAFFCLVLEYKRLQIHI